MAKANAERMVKDSIVRAVENVRSGKIEDPDEWEYGDGDQSLLDANSVDGRTILNLVDSLADFPYLFENGLFSDWAIACYNKDLREAKRLLRREPRILDKRETLLRLSGLHFVFWGHNDGSEIEDTFFEYLVDSGVPVDARDSRGLTVLYYCLMYPGSSGFQKANYLVSRGADVNAKDRFGTPLLFIKTFEDPSCYEWLLRNGANFNALNSEGLQFTRFAGVNCKLQIAVHFLRECQRQRRKAKKNGSYRTCFVCKKRGVQKRCGGCYLIWYCCKDCQVN